MFDLIIRCQR